MPRKLMRGQCGRLRREEARAGDAASRLVLPAARALCVATWPHGRELKSRKIGGYPRPAASRAKIRLCARPDTRHRFSHISQQLGHAARARTQRRHTGLTADETALRRDLKPRSGDTHIVTGNAGIGASGLVALFRPRYLGVHPKTQTVERDVMQSNTVHPCDERLPAGQLLTLGIQHVLVMYAGAVAVPLIVGAALKLPKDQIAFLISADLFSCGIATLIQTLGLWIFGIRLPVIMGCTFAAVGPMVAIGTNPSLGILDIFGSTIAAGVIGILLAPAVGKLLRFFPPVVIGVVISVIGLSLMGVGINWAAGGVGNPDYGNPVYLGLSLIVLM